MAGYLPRGVPRREEELRLWLRNPAHAFREAGGPARVLVAGSAAAPVTTVFDVVFERLRAEQRLVNAKEVLRILRYGGISLADVKALFCTASLVAVCGSPF